MKKQKALVVQEKTNMYGGMHTTNFAKAKKALEQGRDIIVHQSQYDGQKYQIYKYRVKNLRYVDNDIIGDYADNQTRANTIWTAAKDVCDFAQTGKI